jgi:hypothetical protein
MPIGTVKKAVTWALYASLSVCTASIAANANTTTFNVTSNTTNAPSQVNGPTVINLNGYTYSSYDVQGVSGDNLTINGPGTVAVQNGGILPNLTINNATAEVNPGGNGYNWLWVTTGTAPKYGSPDDYIPLLNGTLTLNSVALTNWSGVRANTFVTSGNTSLTQIVDGFSGSFLGNNLINTGTLSISSKNPTTNTINNNGGNLFITSNINNSGTVNVNKGGSLYLGYMLSGLPESVSGNVGNVNVNGGTVFMNNMNHVSGNINETGGLVSGYGTFNGNITNDGGSFFPGNNLTFIESKNGVEYLPTELPNQMTINGNYVQNNASTYVAYIWPGNNNNTKLVVNGYASIAGTLAVTAEPSNELILESGKAVSTVPYGIGKSPTGVPTQTSGPQFTSGDSYTLISAKYVSGSFSKAVYVDNSNTKAESNTVNGLTPYLAYGNQQVQLTLCKAGAGYCGTALKVVDPKLVSADSVPHTTLAQLEFSGGAVVSNIIGGAPAGAWIKALGSFGHLAGYNTSGAGSVAGYGFHMHNADGHWVFGPAFSYGYNTVGSNYSNTNSNSYGFWLYGGWHNKSWKVTAVGGGGFTQNNETTAFDTINSGQTNYSGSFWDLAVRPSYWLRMSSGFVLSPRMTFNYGSSRTSAFSQTFGPTNYSIGSAQYSVFTVSPSMLIGDNISLGALSIDPQVRVGLNENVGPTTTFGLPHTQGTAEARLNVDESKDLFGVLSWKYTYGGGQGYGYNTVMASARYLW